MITIVLIVQMLLECIIMILAQAAILLIIFFVLEEKVRPYYYRCKEKRYIKQRVEKDELILQQRHRRELRDREREKYPLFYWKENIV
ncbi:unnamed protein product [marine sediment metagenome]|uniref:Uncharacterized protein n=1 Tax=marine sediment metagenome TaxID=412755 RepID=X0X7G1_9ZZZZ